LAALTSNMIAAGPPCGLAKARLTIRLSAEGGNVAEIPSRRAGVPSGI
jgi:hypothetical protein